MAKKKDKKNIENIEKNIEEEVKTQTEEELRQKCKNLASIIEEMSGEMESLNQSQVESIIEPKIKEVDQKFETNIQEVKGAIEDLSKKIEKPVKMKADVTSTINEINEKLEPRLASLEEKIKSADKIQDLEQQIKSLSGDSKKGTEATPKKLSLLEEKIIQTMQEEIISVKDSLQNLSNDIEVFKDRTDKKMQKFFEHLSPETVKKLEELIAYLDKAVPSKVREEVGEKLNSLFDQLKNLRNFSDDLEKKLNETYNQVKDDRDKIKSILELKHELKGSIIDLEINKEKISKQIEESEQEAEKRYVDLEFKVKTQVDVLNKKFKDFEEVLDNYAKITQDRVNKVLSEFSETNLSTIEKKYYTSLSSTQQNIKNLESQLKKFVNFVNMNFSSIKENTEDLNLHLEKFKELEKQEHLKSNKIIELQKSDIQDALNKHTEFIRDEVNHLFSGLTEQKLSEIEKRYHDYLSEISQNAKIIQSKLSKFEKTFNTTITSFDGRINNISSDIGKLKESDNEAHFKLNKKIDLDIEKLESLVKEKSDNIENNVNQIFSDLAKSKISEIDNRFEDIVKEINEKNNILNSQLLEFKNTINSNLSSFTEDIGKINFQLNKINEKQVEFAFKTDIDNINEKFKDVVKETSNVRSIKEQIEKNVKNNLSDELNKKITTVNSRISNLRDEIHSIKNMVKKELDKKIAADKIRFEETLEKIMNEKRSLEKILSEQNEKINSILGELNTE